MSEQEKYADLITQLDKEKMPRHIAIIMDGNGRWAEQHHLPRTAGHKAGAEALRRTVEICREIELPILSVYAFSTENWQRPAEEVSYLMRLFIEYLRNEVKLMNKQNIRLGFLGDRSGLPANVQQALNNAQTATADNDKMILNIAVNYGGRDELVRAMRSMASDVKQGKLEISAINEQLVDSYLDTAGEADPDLLIRPSGEQRISNFLLWQGAYQELCFSGKYWPDFTKRDLLLAVLDYQSRSRRFGKTEAQISEKENQKNKPK